MSEIACQHVGTYIPFLLVRNNKAGSAIVKEGEAILERKLRDGLLEKGVIFRQRPE